MPSKEIPRGYYAMTVGELRSFLNGRDDRAELRIEIDNDRYPVIKMICSDPQSVFGHIVMRVPESRNAG